MPGADRVTGLPFLVFAHVEQNVLRIFSQSNTRFLHGNFLHLGPRFVDDFQKSWRMNHGETISGRANWSNGFPRFRRRAHLESATATDGWKPPQPAGWEACAT